MCNTTGPGERPSQKTLVPTFNNGSNSTRLGWLIRRFGPQYSPQRTLHRVLLPATVVYSRITRHFAVTRDLSGQSSSSQSFLEGNRFRSGGNSGGIYLSGSSFRGWFRKPRHGFGRTLAYVYLEEGTFLNAEIVRQGYGHAYTQFPFKYLQEFRALEREAREAQRGLWGP